jgi:hypothetical protein
VLAPRTAEVVRYAGGWLFDRVMAGWSTTVHTGDHADPRPLHILGAAAADLESVLGPGLRGPAPQVLAVDAQLCGSDPRVRKMVQHALDTGAEVRLWGERWPAELTGEDIPMLHRLSVAARAFKAQALAAAADTADAVEGTETFRCGRDARPASVDDHPSYEPAPA